MKSNASAKSKKAALHADGKEAFDFLEDITPFLYGKALTYIDVGAYVGEVYKALSRSKLYIRHAHLIEPNPETYNALLKATDTQRRGRYSHCHNVALGADAGFALMQSEGGMSHVLKQDDVNSPADERRDTFQIEVVPLDSFVDREGIRHINLLKIDVEGFEMEVLGGARQLLAENRIDVLYIEAGLSRSGEQQTYYRLIEDYLNGFGYKIFRIYEQKNEWPEDSAALRRANFAFMSDAFLAKSPYKVTIELFEARQELQELRQRQEIYLNSIFGKMHSLWQSKSKKSTGSTLQNNKRNFYKPIRWWKKMNIIKNIIARFFAKKIEVVKTGKSVIRLRKRLRNLGFYDRGRRELMELVQGNSRRTVSYAAAQELLQFHMDSPRGEPDAVIETCLQIVQKEARSSSERRAAAIMAAELHRSQARNEVAQRLLSDASRKQTHPDLFLAMANLEDEGSEKARYVNQALSCQGLTPVALGSSTATCLLDCLEVDREALRPVDGSELVSVIIPSYNSEKTIITALRSIQNQTWRNFECVIVDDCSTDKTVEVVKQFIAGDDRFTLLSLDENSGAYVARNTGLDKTSGQFITCHDADDWSHPSKLELQVKCLLDDDHLLASMSSQARASDQMVFTRRGRFGSFISENLSSLMLRREVFEELGYWDSVRFGADGELVRRFKKIFGGDRLHKMNKFLSIQRYSPTSLTGSSRFGYDGFFFGARLYYFERQNQYHADRKALKYSFPLHERPFAVPRSMLPAGKTKLDDNHFDVIIVSDFRMQGGSTLSSIEEIQAQHRAGLRTGIVQMCRYDFDPNRSINPKVAALLDSGAAEIIVYGEEVTCDLLLVRYPPVLQERQVFVPKVQAQHIKVLINQPPMSDYGPNAVARYSIPECVKNLREYFGKDAEWHSIGPAVRDAIEKHHPEWLNSANFSKDDWHNIVDLRAWRRAPDHKISARPVIGRHSRDHEMKWPADRNTLLSIYPNSSEFEVRVLGGAKQPKKVLGELPNNWTVYPFDGISPAEFLASLDVFVYFTNDSWIEAFGRVIIEAMSVGVPVILPHSYRPLFEGAALYATPAEVQPLVRKLVSDPDFYQSRVETAFAYVDEKFGYGMHEERVKAFLKRDVTTHDAI